MSKTRAFAVRISRDVTLRDCLVPEGYVGDPYRETVYNVEITLPAGYRVAESSGGTQEVYNERGRHCQLMLFRARRATSNSFGLRGRLRYTIDLIDADGPPTPRYDNRPGLPVTVLA